MKYRKTIHKSECSHSFSKNISTCKNIPRVYFTMQNDINSTVCSMTPSSSMYLDFNSFLACQRIHFGDNPVKGFSRNPGMHFNASTIKATQQDVVTATRYIPHSPISSHSSVRLHSSVNSQLCKFTQPSHMQTAPYSPVGLHTALVRPCSMYLLLQ